MQTVEANGARIPLLGLGTWDLRGRECMRTVEAALGLGYRHIDTAAMYRNEDEAGRPSAHVPRFHTMAAISSANTMAKPAPLPT